MKGLAIIYSLIIFLLSATTAALAEPQLVARVAVASLMHDSVSMRTLLAAEPEGTALVLRYEEGSVSFSHPRPVLDAGQGLTLQLQGVTSSAVEIYPRDTTVVTWQAEDSRLRAQRAGKTEVIFIVAKTMHVLPLRVRAAPHEQPAAEELALAAIEQPAAPSLPIAPREFARERPAYRSIEMQVVDERTTASEHYPVSGMQVSVIGSSLRLRTDARGVVRLAEVPPAARLLLKLHDPRRRYRPAMQEIFVHQAQSHYQLTVRRELSFSTMQTIIGRSQDTRLASLCAVLDGVEGESGFSIDSDVPADGAYYFNQLGLLAPQQQATGVGNRFCLFNIDPGPLTLFIDDAEGRRRAVFTVGLAAGRHREEVFTMSEGQPYRSWLAVADDMHDPFSEHSDAGIVDFVQMRMVGDDRYFTKVEDGLLETAHAPDWHRGRSYAVTRAAEFEDTLYQFNATARVGTLPLLLRGFIENTALLAGAVYDASRGSVVIEHGARQGEDAAAISLRLIDTEGRDVPTTWAVQEGGVTRSVFLNLDYGIYQVIAQNDDGYWLAAGTVVVYNETVSFLRTGAALVYGNTL